MTIRNMKAVSNPPRGCVSRAGLFAAGLLVIPWSAASAAPLEQEIAACAAIAESAPRLACYDSLAARGGAADRKRDLTPVTEALDKAFTLSSARLRSGPLRFRIPVKGVYSPANRAETFPMPEVENAASKIRRALSGFEGWRLAVVVHPAVVKFGRTSPYSGEELKEQVADALRRARIRPQHYAVETGSPVEGSLSNVDLRREANALVTIHIVGLE